MAEDRTLLAFISVVRGRAESSRLRSSVEDQFVNSALIRARSASGICFSDCQVEKERWREREKKQNRAGTRREI